MYEFLAHYYDQIHASLTADLPLVQKLAQENDGPVLDLGCGTGRLLFPLAEAGIKVTGVDNSEQMLNITRSRMAAKPEGVRDLITLWQKDIRSLARDQTKSIFSLALLSYNTLMHFREGEIGGLLKSIAGLLRPGGQLYIDMENPFLLTGAAYAAEPVFETSFLDGTSSQQVEQWSQSSLDTKGQTLTVTWQFRTKDKKSETPAVQIVYHYLYPHQIAMLLEEAGLRLEEMMGNYEGEPFQEESERLLVLAGSPD